MGHFDNVKAASQAGKYRPPFLCLGCLNHVLYDVKTIL